MKDRRIRKSAALVFRGEAGHLDCFVDQLLNNCGSEIGALRYRGLLSKKDAKPEAVRNRLLKLLDFPHAHRDGESLFLANEGIRGGGAHLGGTANNLLGGGPQAVHHFSVPPTVISRILIVGKPTETGIVCPSFPQMPTP